MKLSSNYCRKGALWLLAFLTCSCFLSIQPVLGQRAIVNLGKRIFKRGGSVKVKGEIDKEKKLLEESERDARKQAASLYASLAAIVAVVITQGFLFGSSNGRREATARDRDDDDAPLMGEFACRPISCRLF